jgi:hypothetical protein
MSQPHPEFAGPLVLRPNGVAPFCEVKHPYGRSQMKQSTDFGVNPFITSKQSPRKKVAIISMWIKYWGYILRMEEWKDKQRRLHLIHFKHYK